MKYSLNLNCHFVESLGLLLYKKIIAVKQNGEMAQSRFRLDIPNFHVSKYFNRKYCAERMLKIFFYSGKKLIKNNCLE